MNANVDDKFSAWLTAALAIEDGEAVVEVEEAWVEATALPGGFGAKFGRFYSGIGYLNSKHAHSWDFADQPLPYQAFLAGQVADDGVQLRWLAPTDIYLELGAEALRGGAYPANGAAHDGIGSYTVFAKTGGDIGVKSSPGKGSTFTLTISTGSLEGVLLIDNPTEPECHVEQPGESSVVHNAKLNCRVLIAEDGPDNQRIISFILKKAGAEVTAAENGQVALDCVQVAQDEGNPFDVILMDMQMPVKDGYDATKTLRANGYSKPIIALTAHAMAEDRQKCLDAGCDDYMTKPIDRVMLVELVAQYAQTEDCVNVGS